MAAVEVMPDWQCRLLSPEEIQYLIGRLANLGMPFPREEIHSRRKLRVYLAQIQNFPAMSRI
jgi:hypothetical protein